MCRVRRSACLLAIGAFCATASGAQAIRIECEDFAGPWREQTNIPGYSGRGFVVSNADGVATSAMSKRIAIPAAGTYFVWARGWEGTERDRSWRVQFGETLLDPTHAGRHGGRFSWQRCGEVELPAGEVEIRLIDAGTSYEVADAIMLTTDPDLDPGEEERRRLALDPDEAESMAFDEIMARTRAYAAAMPVAKTREEWQARAAGLRPPVMRSLGLDPLPERTPLNVRILGDIERDGYRIQRVIFESRPGLIVTANVYVPDGEGPFPLVLCPVGHWGRGKNEPTPAARNRGLARLGYITITYDPFGQEERNIPGNAHDEAWRLSLTGHCNMSIMVWDTVRALDYMLTRSDVDPGRIACTGASGGGLNTLYFSVADDRLDVAAPVVYITQWADFFGTGARHCPCSHVPGLGRFTDMGEMTALFGPKPQMYIDAEEDPQFLTVGAQRAYEQARVPYELLGAGDRLLLRSFAGGHDYGQAMRETLYGFLAQHLLDEGDTSPIPERPDESAPPEIEKLWCFEGGKLPQTGKTVRQLAEEWAQDAIERLPGPAAFDPEATRGALLETLHPPSPEEQPRLDRVGKLEADGLRVRKLALHVQSGITLPVLFAAGEPGAPVAVIADGSPDPATARELLRAAHAAGMSAMYVAPRGQGETAWDEHVICTDNMLLGDSTLGQRAYDLAAAGRALKAMPGMADRPIGLLALGSEAGLAGLSAQAMWRDFDAAAVGPIMGSYMDAFGRGIPMMAYVAGILHAADVPHVAALAADRPLLVAFTTPPEGKWASHLSRKTSVADGLPVEEALSWLGDRTVLPGNP